MKKNIWIILLLIIILLSILIIPNIFIKNDEDFLLKNNMIDEYNIIIDKMDDINLTELNVVDKEYTIEGKKYTADYIENGSIYVYEDYNYGTIKSDDMCITKNYNDSYFDEVCIESNSVINTKDIESEYLVDDTIENIVNDDNVLSSKKYYTGSNPNNYIVVENACYRIINITKNDSLKLVYESEVIDGKCHSDNNTGKIGIYYLDLDRYTNNSWNEEISLSKYFEFFENDMYIENDSVNIKLNENLMVPTYWNIGVINENTTINQDVEDELSVQTNTERYLGLVSNIDYLKISCNTSSILADEKCSLNNYLYKSKYEWYTMNQSNSDPKPFLFDFDEGTDQKEWWFVNKSGSTEPKDLLTPFSYYYGAVRVSFHIKNDIELIGNGTEETPYFILNY